MFSQVTNMHPHSQSESTNEKLNAKKVDSLCVIMFDVILPVSLKEPYAFLHMRLSCYSSLERALILLITLSALILHHYLEPVA